MLRTIGEWLFGESPHQSLYQLHSWRPDISPFEDSAEMVNRVAVNLEREALSFAFLKRAALVLIIGTLMLWLITVFSTVAIRWVNEQWTGWRTRVVQQTVDKERQASQQRVDAARAVLEDRMTQLETLKRGIRP